MSVLIDLTDDDEGGGGGMVPSRFTCVKCSFINMIMFDKIRICKVRQDSDPPYLLLISCTSLRETSIHQKYSINSLNTVVQHPI